VFVEQENIVCTLKWPSVIAKNGKIFILQRKKFGRIDSRIVLKLGLVEEKTLFQKSMETMQ
jgi:hypothetical protein